MSPPPVSQYDGAWRRERRAAVRRHHPDAGGSPGALQAALAEIDRRHARAAPGPTTRTDGVVVSPPARLQRLVRGLRHRIPAGWPGHRPRRPLR